MSDWFRGEGVRLLRLLCRALLDRVRLLLCLVCVGPLGLLTGDRKVLFHVMAVGS